MKDIEAAIGRVFTLAFSTDLIPNLKNLVIVGLVYQEGLSELFNESFKRIGDLERIGFIVSTATENVNSNDLIDPEFAKKIAEDLVRGTPYYSDEALTGEDWRFDVLDMRLKSLELIQSKIKPNPKLMLHYVI